MILFLIVLYLVALFTPVILGMLKKVSMRWVLLWVGILLFPFFLVVLLTGLARINRRGVEFITGRKG